MPAEPVPAPQPPAMPKTASPFPAVGLAGLLLVGVYGLLRFGRAVYLK